MSHPISEKTLRLQTLSLNPWESYLASKVPNIWKDSDLRCIYLSEKICAKDSDTYGSAKRARYAQKIQIHIAQRKELDMRKIFRYILLSEKS